MRHLLFPCLFLCLPLTACNTPNLGPQVSLNEKEFIDFSLDARTIEFKSTYSELTTNIYVNQLMQALENWARAHFKTTSSQGHALIEFDEVVGQDVLLEKKPGTLLTREQAGRLEGAIALKISIQNDRGFRQKYLEVRTNRSQTYPENATLLEKEKIWRSVINSILNALNSKLKEAMGD
ncbi:MAG: hypothetical protein JSS34_01440 [Proteobacteria bacterium]|nr:hypothetical protein [Pseudomonadota bacterium]